jgi:transcriptional regulator with GAF, ATPase, and Fis domain
VAGSEEEEAVGEVIEEEGKPPTVPEAVYKEKESVRHDDELSHLIDRIDEKVGQLLDIRRIGSVYNDFVTHLGVSTGAVLFKNQEGVLAPFISSGLTSRTETLFNFTKDDKILMHLLQKGKTLHIKEKPFMNRELKNKFETVDSSKIKEIFLSPVFKSNKLLCIIAICITRGEMFDSDLIIKEIKKLVKIITKII